MRSSLYETARFLDSFACRRDERNFVTGLLAHQDAMRAAGVSAL